MNKIKLFIEKEIQKEKNIYLRELYLSGDFKPEELLFFFPNNYLKRNHIPMLQGGRRKRYKKYRLASRRLFKTLEKIIDERVSELFTSSSPFYNQFVDFKNINEGDSLWAKENQDTILTNHRTNWERPVYTLNRITRPAGASMDGMWENVKEIPTTVLRCTTRSLPAEVMYRRTTE